MNHYHPSQVLNKISLTSQEEIPGRLQRLVTSLIGSCPIIGGRESIIERLLLHVLHDIDEVPNTVYSTNYYATGVNFKIKRGKQLY